MIHSSPRLATPHLASPRLAPPRHASPRRTMRSYTSPLSTEDILAVVHAHPLLRGVSAGVYPLDGLARLVVSGRPAHVIYNQLPSWAPQGAMGHWVSIYLSADLRAEVMSSLGDRPDQIEVIEFMGRHCTSAVFTAVQIQDDNSNCCGVYALSHGMARARGTSLRTWLGQFGACRTENDKKIQCEFLQTLSYPALFTHRFNWRRALAATCGALRVGGCRSERHESSVHRRRQSK